MNSNTAPVWELPDEASLLPLVFALFSPPLRPAALPVNPEMVLDDGGRLSAALEPLMFPVRAVLVLNDAGGLGLFLCDHKLWSGRKTGAIV